MKSACRIVSVVVACSIVGGTGCGKKETPAPTPEADGVPLVVTPTPQPADKQTGTVKFESAFKDPKTLIVIDGSEYRLPELGSELELKTSPHHVQVKLGKRVLQSRDFTLAKGQRLIVELYDPERRAAEWAHRLGGEISVTGDSGRHVDVPKDKSLPDEYFQVSAIRLHGIKGVSTEGLENLRDLRAIAELNLGDTFIGDAGVEYLKDLKSLKVLNLRNARLTDDGLAHLKNLTNLDHLILQHIPATGAGYVHLHELPITQLDLSASAVNDAGLKNLHGFKRLNALALFDTKITSDSLAQLKGLNLERLTLGATRTFGPGLAALKEVRGLKDLSFYNAPITDADVPHLRELTGLTALVLTGTQVTDAGVSDLKAALPNCSVIK